MNSKRGYITRTRLSAPNPVWHARLAARRNVTKCGTAIMPRDVSLPIDIIAEQGLFRPCRRCMPHAARPVLLGSKNDRREGTTPKVEQYRSNSLFDYHRVSYSDKVMTLMHAHGGSGTVYAYLGDAPGNHPYDMAFTNMQEAVDAAKQFVTSE